LRTVLGGHEVTPRPREILESHPAVDFVVFGEGEETFGELLGRLSKGLGPEGVLGLAWRSRRGVVVEGPRPPIAELSRLPSPYLSGSFGDLSPYTTLRLETTRGCPFKCRYCGGWKLGAARREFPLERLERELEALPPSARFLHLVDADPCWDLDRGSELFSRLGPLLAERPEAELAFSTYLGRWSPELAAKAAGTGRLEISAGIQTTNRSALRLSRRFFDRESNERVSRMLCRHPRVRLLLELILGLPEDTLEGYRESLNWALSIQGSRLNLTVLLAMPGTEFREAPGSYGLKHNPRPPYDVISTPSMPEEDMRRARWISFWITCLQMDRFLRDSLWQMGDRARGSLAYLSPFERLGRVLGERNPGLERAAEDFVFGDLMPFKELAGEPRREALRALRELIPSGVGARGGGS